MNLKPLSKSSVTNTKSINSIVHGIPRIINPILRNAPKKFYLSNDDGANVKPSATYWSPNDLLTVTKRQHGYDFYNIFCHQTKSGSSLNGRKLNSTYKTAGKYRKFIGQYRNCNSNEKLVEVLRQVFAQSRLNAFYCEKVDNQNGPNGPNPKTSKDDACQIKKERIAQRNLDIYNIKTNIDGLCKSRMKKDDPCKQPKEVQKPKLEATIADLPLFNGLPSKYGGDDLLPWGLIKSKSLNRGSDLFSKTVDICDHKTKDICPASDDCAIEKVGASAKQLSDDPCTPGEDGTSKSTKLASSSGQDASSQPQNGGDGSMKVGGDGNNNRRKLKCKKVKIQCGPKKCKTMSDQPTTTPKMCHDVSKALDAINEMQKDPCKKQVTNNNVPYKIVDGKIVCQIKNMCCVLEKFDPCNAKHKNIAQPKAGDRQFCCKIKDMFCICTKMDEQNGQVKLNTCPAPDCQVISKKSSAEEDFEKRMGGICSAFKKKAENMEGVAKNGGASILESACKVDDKVNSKEQIKTTQAQIQEFYQSPLQKLKCYLQGSQSLEIDPKVKDVKVCDDGPTVGADGISVTSPPTSKPKVLSDVELSNICERQTKPKRSICAEKSVPTDLCKAEDAKSIMQDPCKSIVPHQISCTSINLARECLAKAVKLEDACKDDLGKKAPCQICGDKIVCEFEDRTCVCEVYNPCKLEHRDPSKVHLGDKKSICKIGDLHCECTKRCDLFAKIKDACKSTGKDSGKSSFPLCIDLSNGEEDSIRIENCRMVEGKVVIELQKTCCVCEKFDPCNPDHVNIAKPKSADKMACCVIEDMYCQCVQKSDVEMPTMVRDVNASCSGGAAVDGEDALFQAIFDRVKLERAARRKGTKYPKIQQMNCSDGALKTDLSADLCKKAKASCSSFEGNEPTIAPKTNCDFDVKENTVKSNQKTCGKVKWAIPLAKKKDKSCEQLAKAICESIEVASEKSGSKNICRPIVSNVNKSPAKMKDVLCVKGDSAHEMIGICRNEVEKSVSKIKSMAKDCVSKLKEKQSSECSIKSNLQQNDDCVKNLESKKAKVPQSDSVKSNVSKIDCEELLKKSCAVPKRQDTSSCMSKLKQVETCVPQMSDQCRQKDIKSFSPKQLICDSIPSKMVKIKKICIPQMNQKNTSLADACISRVTANNMQEGNAPAPQDCNLYLKMNKKKSDERKQKAINIYLNLSPAGGSKVRPGTLDPCVKSKICKPQKRDYFECKAATSSALKVLPPIIMADFCINKKKPCSKLDPPLPKFNHPSAKVDPCKAKIKLPTHDPNLRIEINRGVNRNLKLDSKPTPPLDNKNKGDPCKGNAADATKSKNDPCKQKNDSCETAVNSGSNAFNCSEKFGSMKDPCGSKGSGAAKRDPCAPKEDSGAAKIDPCAPKEDPSAPKTDPCKTKIDPCAPKDPSAPKTDPCAPKEDRSAPKIDPCAPKEDPSAPKTDPCKTKIDPCAPKDPSAPKTDPCAPKEDPSAPKTDPCKTKIDPCAPKDPSAPKTDPCAPKEDRSAPKIDPCAPKEDPSAPKTDPCKTRIDPCAPKEDPCKSATNKSIDSVCGKSLKVESNPCKPAVPCNVDVDPCKALADPCKAMSQCLDSCNKKPDACLAKVVDPCEKDILVYPPLEELKLKKPEEIEETEEVSKPNVDPLEIKETLCAAPAVPCTLKSKPKPKPKQKPCEPPYIDPNRVDESLCTPLKPKINYEQGKDIPYEVVKRDVPPDQCKDQVRMVMSDMLKPKPDPCKAKYEESPAKTSMCVPLPEAYKTMTGECKPVASAAKLFVPTKEVKEQKAADSRASVDSCIKANEAKMKKDGSSKLPCSTKILPKILADPCDPITTRLGVKANVISKYHPSKLPDEETKETCKETFIASNEDPGKPKCERKMDPCEIVTFPSATKVDPCFAVGDEKRKIKHGIRKGIKIPLHKQEAKEDVDSDMCKFSACNEDAPFNLQEELKKKQQYCTKAEPCIVEQETSKKTSKKEEEFVETHDGSKCDPCSEQISCEIKRALQDAKGVTGKSKKSSGVNETNKSEVNAILADIFRYPCPVTTSPVIVAKKVCSYGMVNSFAKSKSCDPNCPCKVNPEMNDPKLGNVAMVEPKVTKNAPVMENIRENVQIDDPCLNRVAVEDPGQQVAQCAASKAEKLKARIEGPMDSLCVKDKDPREKERLEKLKLSDEMCKKLKGSADEAACSYESDQIGKSSCKYKRKTPCADQIGGCPEGGTGKGSCYQDSCQNVLGIYDRPDCRPPPQQNQPPFKPTECPKTQMPPQPIDAETVTFPSIPRPEVPECTTRREIYPPPGMVPPFMNPPTDTTCTTPSRDCCTEESAPLRMKCDTFPNCSVIYDASKHQPWCAVQVNGEPQVASGRTCREYIKRKQDIDGTSSTILPNLNQTPSSPRFDVTLPEPKYEDKGIVAGTKGLLQSICRAICPMNKKGDGKSEATGYTKQHANCEGIQPKAGCTLLPECGSEEDKEAMKAKSLKQWPFLEQIHKPGPNVLKGCQTKHDMQAYMANKRKCQPNPIDTATENPPQTSNKPDPNAKWRKC